MLGQRYYCSVVSLVGAAGDWIDTLPCNVCRERRDAASRRAGEAKETRLAGKENRPLPRGEERDQA